MLQFEKLLLKKLQKQQNRDEFCDIVLHTQGVSVPIHSCILSAFSTKLHCTLSTMPTPASGQRRMLDLQDLDADTLLSLVSLLYSGQFFGNQEQVCSAAKSLGIELPVHHQEERHGGDAEKTKELYGTAEKTGGNKLTDRATQTESERYTDKHETQTDDLCTDFQSLQSVCLISQSTAQCPETYISASDSKLTLEVIHDPAQTMPSTCDVSVIAPEIGGHQSVSDSQMYIYSEDAYFPPPTPVTPHPVQTPNTYVEQPGSTDMTQFGDDHRVNEFMQFQDDIPGFISYFLEPARSQRAKRRGRGCQRKGPREVTRRARVRSRGRGTGRGGRGRKRQWDLKRWGCVPGLAWRGQGGGRVGRRMDSRTSGTNPAGLFKRRRGRGALASAGEMRGKAVYEDNIGQGEPPRKKRPRGQPRIRQLPSVPRSSYDPKNVGSPGSTLLHTMPLSPDPQTEPLQPIDRLLNDIITELHILPTTLENQCGLDTSTSNVLSISDPMHPNTQSAKSTNPRQQTEGELTDFLDHFLRTFEEQVGGSSTNEKTDVWHYQSENFTTVNEVDGAQETGNEDQASTALCDLDASRPTQGSYTEERLKNLSTGEKSVTKIMTRSQSKQKVNEPSEQKRPQVAQMSFRHNSCEEDTNISNNVIDNSNVFKFGLHKKAHSNISAILTRKQRPDRHGQRKRKNKEELPQIYYSKRKRRVGKNKGNRGRKKQEAVEAINCESLERMEGFKKRRYGVGGIGLRKSLKEKRYCSNRRNREREHEAVPLKNPTVTAYSGVASSAFEKMKMLLQIQNENEEDHQNGMEHEEIFKENQFEVEANHSNPQHVDQELAGEMVQHGKQGNGESVAQGIERPVSVELVEDEEQPTNGGKLKEIEEFKSKSSTSKCSSGFSSLAPTYPVSGWEILRMSVKRVMRTHADQTLDSGAMATVAVNTHFELPHTPALTTLSTPCPSVKHALLGLHPSQIHVEQALPELQNSEEEEVDVLGVSSPECERTGMEIAAWDSAPNTEEDEVDEDVEIDVLSVDSNSSF